MDESNCEDVALSPVGKPPASSLATDVVSMAFATLSRIDKVGISQRIERDGQGCYVVEVFLRPNAQALRRQDAARNIFQRAKPLRVSDYQVDHGYAAFAALRQAVNILVRHPACDRCVYCSRLSAYLRGDWCLPSAGLRLATTRRVKMRMLTTFVNRLLKKAASSEAIATADPSCRACVQAPLLLEQFLRRPRESSLGII
jgi:hypothetical protein